MKLKLIALALLLILAACGEAAASPEPVESATPEHEEIIEPVAAGPVELPDVGFEAASMWYADGFGDGGRAVLFLGEPSDGTMDMALYMSQRYYTRHTEDISTSNTDAPSYSLSAASEGDGWRFELDGFSVYLEADDAELTLLYSNPTGNPDLTPDGEGGPTRLYEYGWYRKHFNAELYYPTRFSRLSSDDAPTVWWDMPMYAGEIATVLPLSGKISDLTDLFGEENFEVDSENFTFYIDVDGLSLFGYLRESDPDTYFDLSTTATKAEYAPVFRGITIGCSYLDLLSRSMLDTSSEQNESYLYGNNTWGSFAFLDLMYGNMTYYDAGTNMTLRYFFDDDGIIDCIRFFWAVG